MYISKIEIRNFRIFDEAGITAYFKKGVNAIISANNCGKSAIIDAIRIAFSTVLYKKDIFFNISDFHVGYDGKRAEEALISVYFDERPADFFELWDPEDENKGEFHVRYYVARTPEGKERVRYNIWGGPVEGNVVSAETFEAIQLVFLGALRDAETEMRPARSSKLASLFSSVAKSDEVKEDITDVMRRASREILTKDPIIQLSGIVNDNLATIEKDVLKQRIELGIVEPQFNSIAASLRAWLKPRWFYIEKDDPNFTILKMAFSGEKWDKYSSEDENGAFLDLWALKEYEEEVSPEVNTILEVLSATSFDLFQNGLGYNNLLFMSTVLGDMKTGSESALFNLLLVEEPEAHLHPQLQELVHQFFVQNTDKNNFQVIYTSHSPTLVSRIGIDKLVLLYESDYRINCLSFSQSNLDDEDRDHIERYLDVTRSQMLFAKGIIFVEGICEALLIPVFAEYLDRPLDKYAVEVVNVDGVSFKPFANLICYANDTQKKTVRAAIITDDDRCTDKNDREHYINKDNDYDTDDLASIVARLNYDVGSVRFRSIKELCSTAHINVFGAKKTLEYELASKPDNIAYLVDAIKTAQPSAGEALEKYLSGLDSDVKKAASLWLYMRERSKYKGEVAQNLARQLKKELRIRKFPKEGDPELTTQFVIPDYIKNAIYSVTEEG